MIVSEILKTNFCRQGHVVMYRVLCTIAKHSSTLHKIIFGLSLLCLVRFKFTEQKPEIGISSRESWSTRRDGHVVWNSSSAWTRQYGHDQPCTKPLVCRKMLVSGNSDLGFFYSQCFRFTTVFVSCVCSDTQWASLGRVAATLQPCRLGWCQEPEWSS